MADSIDIIEDSLAPSTWEKQKAALPKHEFVFFKHSVISLKLPIPTVSMFPQQTYSDCINLCLKGNKGQKPYKNMKLRKIRHCSHSIVSLKRHNGYPPRLIQGLMDYTPALNQNQEEARLVWALSWAVPHRAGVGTADQPCHQAVVRANTNGPCCALGENSRLVLPLPTIQQRTKQAFGTGGSLSSLLLSPSQCVLLHSSCSELLQTSPLK